MSSEACVLTVDCGTQSLRAMIFDTAGSLLAIEKRAYIPYLEPRPGWAEQDPEVYWEALVDAVRGLRTNHGELFDRIEGLGVTTQRDTMVCLDREGKALRPAIIWLDQRKASPHYFPKFPMRQAYAVVGISDTIRKIQREGKSNWIREHEPELWKRIFCYTSIAGMFTYRMTGKWLDSTACQIGHIPFDYRRQCWASPRKLTARLYPIPRGRLCPLVQPGEVLGRVKGGFAELTGLRAGLPLIACGSDKGCETIGMGVFTPKSASLSFGTTATIQTTCSRYVEPLRFLPAYPAPVPGRYNPEVEIFRGFWMITWFKEQFGFKEVSEAQESGISPEELLDRTLATIPPGSMGLMVQPYWSPGIKDPYAKGAMIGFGSVHTREHIYRAMIEGLCYALREGSHRIERVTGIPVERITVSGGASRSDAICHIAADVFGLPLYRGGTAETSGLGAAILTQWGIGSFASLDEAADAMVTHQQEFLPDAENHRLYSRLFAHYRRMFPALKGIYKDVGRITGYPEI